MCRLALKIAAVTRAIEKWNAYGSIALEPDYKQSFVEHVALLQPIYSLAEGDATTTQKRPNMLIRRISS